MPSDLASSIEEALSDYADMPTDEQRKKVNQILLMHTNGDHHAAEGLRLTFEALLAAQAKIRTVDDLHRTLDLKNAPEVGEKLQTIDDDITELTHLLFPFDRAFARELVTEQYRCETQ